MVAMVSNLSDSFIPLSVSQMSGQEIASLSRAFESNWVSHLGHEVDAFERRFADYMQTQGAFATHSGTAALHLAMRCLNVSAGDVVLCSSLTFVATLNPILYTGAEPVFIDSAYDTWGMCPEALARALLQLESEGKTAKAIVVASLYGQSADMVSITALAKEYGIPVIEDACEALGGTFRGEKNGSFGTLSAFSFSGNKMITTSAGGMLVTNDMEMIERARWLGLQARDPGVVHYSHSSMGHNYRLSNVLAGVGLAQLDVLDDRVKARRAVYKRYQQAFEGHSELSVMAEPSGSRSSRWLSTVLVRDPIKHYVPDIIEGLWQKNIETRRVFWPMHRQPIGRCYRYFTAESGVSVADDLFERGLCLPSSSSLTVADQQRVVDALLQSVGHAPAVGNSNVDGALS